MRRRLRRPGRPRYSAHESAEMRFRSSQSALSGNRGIAFGSFVCPADAERVAVNDGGIGKPDFSGAFASGTNY